MNINSVEFLKIQGLLLQLVEVLGELTVKVEKTVPTALLPRLVALPQEVMKRHMIEMLDELVTVQKEVGELVKAPTAIKEPPKDLPEPQKRELPTARREVSESAQKLMREVQKTIVKLSNSEQLRNPQRAPLQEALKELKPSLDQLVRTTERQVRATEHPQFRKEEPPEKILMALKFMEKPTEPLRFADTILQPQIAPYIAQQRRVVRRLDRKKRRGRFWFPDKDDLDRRE